MIGLGWTDADATRPSTSVRKMTRAGTDCRSFYRNPERTRPGDDARICGECRVVTDHHADDPVWTELTDRLRQGS